LKKKRILSKYDKKKYGWLHFAIEFVVGAVICVLIASFIIGIAQVDGNSMNPTLENDQRLVFLRLGDSYEYRDVVAIKMPNGDKYVKRVVGIAGDEIDIRDGQVYLNGFVLSEDYAQGVTEKENEKIEYPVTLGVGQVFVLGDNREESVDSRSFGPIIVDNIRGRILGDY